MDIKEFRATLFERGKELGFQDLELYYKKTDKFLAKVFQGEVDGHTSSTVQGVSIRGLYNGKTGYAFTERLDKDSVTFLLREAAINAELIETEPEEIFTASASYQKIDFYTPALANITTLEKVNLLKEIEQKALDYDKRVVQVNSASIQDHTIEKALFNNKDLALYDRNNFLFVVVSVLVKDAEEVKSSFHVEPTKDFTSLNADQFAKTAVEKALSQLGGKVYPNKIYPVVLQNKAAASLLATYASSFSADAVQDNRSRLKDKLGKQIASNIVTIVDDPFLPDGAASATFDAEGVPTRKHNVIENGKLTTYFHNQKTAKKDGVNPTGHGSRQSIKSAIEISPSNFFVVPSMATTYEQLYENMEEGIIITDLAGLHSGANQISGDFSLAANGYYVKNGSIMGPTNLMTVAGNFFDVLRDVQQVGTDLEFGIGFGSYIGSPSLRVGGLAVTVD